MSGGAFVHAADFEERIGGPSSIAPDRLVIDFEDGNGAIVSFRTSVLQIDTWPDADGSKLATISLKHGEIGMALHIGQSADDMRAFAAGALRAADELDGGTTRQ